MTNASLLTASVSPVAVVLNCTLGISMHISDITVLCAAGREDLQDRSMGGEKNALK